MPPIADPRAVQFIAAKPSRLAPHICAMAAPLGVETNAALTSSGANRSSVPSAARHKEEMVSVCLVFMRRNIEQGWSLCAF